MLVITFGHLAAHQTEARLSVSVLEAWDFLVLQDACDKDVTGKWLCDTVDGMYCLTPCLGLQSSKTKRV